MKAQVGGGAPTIGKGPAVPGTASKRLGTASQSGARPMTAVSGAGYSSKPVSIGTDPSVANVTLEPKVET